jgi:hypothetical protein
MTLKLKALLEGYAWERKADGSLPTLRDAIATHRTNLSESEKSLSDLEYAVKQHEQDNHVYDKTKLTNIYNQLSDMDQKTAKTKFSKYFGSAEPRWQDSDGDGKWYEPGQDVAESINEYGEDEFDRDPQMYGGGKSSREYAGIPSELVEQIEDHVERLMQNLSTNSKIPTSEKEVILKGLVKISDLIDQLQDEL